MARGSVTQAMTRRIAGFALALLLSGSLEAQEATTAAEALDVRAWTVANLGESDARKGAEAAFAIPREHP